MFTLHGHFPRETSSDVKETLCHSFSFCCGYRAAGRLLMSTICLVPTLSEGPPEWSLQRMPLPRDISDDRPTTFGDAQVMGPNYTLHMLFSHNQKKIIFSSCHLPHLHGVNVSTYTGCPGHSQAPKVNTSLTSSGILPSIIKAVSRAICITLSFRGRPGSSGAGHAERTTLMKFGEMTFKTAAAQQDTSDTGELQ